MLSPRISKQTIKIDWRFVTDEFFNDASDERLETFLQGTKKLYIDGKFVPSASGATFDTPNPATGETLMTLYEAQVADVDKAVKAPGKPLTKANGEQCLQLREAD